MARENSGWRDRLDADAYPETPEGTRQWARDSLEADREYHAERNQIKTDVITVLLDEGHPELAKRLEEAWN